MDMAERDPHLSQIGGFDRQREAGEPALSAKSAFPAMMSHELRTPRIGLFPRVRIGSDVPGQLIGGQRRLTQVLLNLAANAISYTHVGKLAITVEIAEHRGDNGPLPFMVRNTDVGITEEQQFLLFQPFCQSEPILTSRFCGCGLELAITQRLCEKMGGTINVKSQLGAARTFIFTALFGDGEVEEGSQSLDDLPEEHIDRIARQ